MNVCLEKIYMVNSVLHIKSEERLIWFKRIFFAVMFLSLSLSIRPTNQTGDVIIINGEEWSLRVKPISLDSVLYSRVRDFLPDNIALSTGNWSGYTAFWEVCDSCIYFKKMEICVYDRIGKKDSVLVYRSRDLQSVFVHYYKDGEVSAEWLSGEFRAGQGDFVRDVNSGFNSNMETEQVLEVKEGRIMKAVTYHNYRRKGFDLQGAYDEVMRLFPWDKFPEYGDEHIHFSIYNPKMTDDGRMLDCSVRSIYFPRLRKSINDENHSLAVAIRETLKSVYPWEVYFVNGKYVIKYESFLVKVYNDKN